MSPSRASGYIGVLLSNYPIRAPIYFVIHALLSGRVRWREKHYGSDQSRPTCGPIRRLRFVVQVELVQSGAGGNKQIVAGGVAERLISALARKRDRLSAPITCSKLAIFDFLDSDTFVRSPVLKREPHILAAGVA